MMRDIRVLADGIYLGEGPRSRGGFGSATCTRLP
jgi:hypothetical protein